MSKAFDLPEFLAADYVSGRLPAVLKELIDRQLDDFDKCIVHIMQASDCMKRCYESLGPQDWKSGDMQYSFAQLEKATKYLSRAIERMGARITQCDQSGGKELPL